MIVPAELSAARLQRNDINLLLGYDAVAAHVEEHAEPQLRAEYGWPEREAGWAEHIAELLRDSKSRVWPPGEVQDLVNIKSAYLLRVQAAGLLIAPTEVLAGCVASLTPAAVMATARGRGWRHFVVKPVPSSWCLNVLRFRVSSAEEGDEDNSRDEEARLREYLGRALVRGSRELLLQEFVPGLVARPEVRAFFWGEEFLYAVRPTRPFPLPFPRPFLV